LENRANTRVLLKDLTAHTGSIGCIVWMLDPISLTLNLASHVSCRLDCVPGCIVRELTTCIQRANALSFAKVYIQKPPIYYLSQILPLKR